MKSQNWMRRLARRTGMLALSLGLTAGAGLMLSTSIVSEANAATLEGQRFEDTAKLGDTTLRLNGLGLRGVAWIKAFVAGLYVAAPSKDAAQLLAMPGAKRVRLKIMLSASSHELTKSLVGRIEDHEPEAVRAKLGDRLVALSTLIDGLGELAPGDTLDLDFIPDKGLSLRYNDKVVGNAVSGEDLYRSVLKIFVGDNPVDRRMKEGLLRGGY